ncbi:MAG: glycosyltransferase family 2 protein [Prevotellaceae bacterium]|jgi:GT2 family glycosyltransferase|nr:glycosyltransferase family 2 protein [Prevotellaceae bacterium]
MKSSVVILNFNGKDYLEKFLPLVVRFSGNAEIVIADNGSTDNSIPFLKNNFPNVRLITFDKNYGFAQGYNLALKQIESDYYVLLNSDVEVTENWLLALENYLDKNPKVVALQPKIRSYDAPQMFEYAGACGGFIDKYGYPFCRGRILQTLEADNGQYDQPVEVFWASGACLMVRADEYWAVGGLDGRFFAHQEEIDLCWRLKARGKRIVCLPQSLVYHVGGGTLNTESPFKTYLNFRNNLFLLYKNMPAKQYYKTMFVRFFLDISTLLLFVLQGKRGNANSVLRAIKDFRKQRKDFSASRKTNLALTTEVFPSGMFKSLIILKYYLGKKRFSQMVRNGEQWNQDFVSE